MPNWVFSSLSVSGDELELQRMMEQLNAPFTQPLIESVFNKETEKWEVVNTRTITYSNPVFAFWNIHRPSEKVWDEYFGVQPKVKSELTMNDPNWWADVEAKRVVSNHWYDWNITNWGTKWEVAVRDDDKGSCTEIVHREDGHIVYRFDTAWSPPLEVIAILSFQFPELVFDLEYEEETGWGGEAVFQNGVMTSITQYDEPSSHQDYVDRDRDCPCTWYAEDLDVYEDCPQDRG